MTEPTDAGSASPNRSQRMVLAIGLAGVIGVIATTATVLIARTRETWVTVGTNMSGYTPVAGHTAVSYSVGRWWGWVGLVWVAGVAVWSAVAYRLLRRR